MIVTFRRYQKMMKVMMMNAASRKYVICLIQNQAKMSPVLIPMMNPWQLNVHGWHRVEGSFSGDAEFDSPDVTFTGVVSGPPPDAQLKTPLEYFQSMIDVDMLELLANETNQHAFKKSGVVLGTSVKELEQLMGMFLRMGLVQMNGNRMYWEQDTRYNPVADVMPRNRFQKLLIVLHFVGNEGVTDDDKRDRL